MSKRGGDFGLDANLRIPREAERPVEAGEPSKTASPEKPEYRKQRQSSPGTQMFMVIVDEGWRSWILCTDMYESKAEHLVEVLRASGTRWPE